MLFCLLFYDDEENGIKLMWQSYIIYRLSGKLCPFG